MDFTRALEKYKALIVDVDGTLYFQPMLRRRMAVKLGAYYALHPWRMKELSAVALFRRLREREGWDGDDALFQQVAGKLGLPEKTVRGAVQRWIEKEPLRFLPGCVDAQLRAFLRRAREKGIAVLIYSDYPAREKLARLGIEADRLFCAADPSIACLKPDPRGIMAVLSAAGFSAGDCLFIGDRDDRDGASARSVGMDYWILPGKRSLRRKSTGKTEQ